MSALQVRPSNFLSSGNLIELGAIWSSSRVHSCSPISIVKSTQLLSHFHSQLLKGVMWMPELNVDLKWIMEAVEVSGRQGPVWEPGLVRASAWRVRRRRGAFIYRCEVNQVCSLSWSGRLPRQHPTLGRAQWINLLKKAPSSLMEPAKKNRISPSLAHQPQPNPR